MRTIDVTVGPLTATNATAIAGSQSGTAKTPLTLTTPTLATTQRISITSGGNDTGVTFTVIGTTFNGDSNTELITGASGGAAFSVSDFSTITSITPSANTAGTVTVGITQSGGSPWVHMDEWALAAITFQCDVTGTVNYAVQCTMDNTNSASNPQGKGSLNPYQMTWFSNLTGISGATTSAFSSISFIPRFMRLYLTSGSGSVTMRVTQAGNVMF